MAIKIAGVDVINDDRELVLAKLTDINSTISSTAVDVFVYDTSNDSDGGAWRHRTQHTSWYNETLNTSTRGSRKEFPSVAVIVAESNKVTIYDGDDPSLPMWMVFNAGRKQIIYENENELSSVSALNGQIWIGSRATAGHVSYASFAGDVGGFITQVGYYPTVSILNRNASYSGLPFGNAIVNRIVNDVAMTVLPDAPTDPATGIAVPTIAVATDGGVSVITDSGAVYDSTSTNAHTQVDFYGKYLFYSNTVSGTFTEIVDASNITADGWTASKTYGYSQPPFLTGSSSFSSGGLIQPLSETSFVQKATTSNGISIVGVIDYGTPSISGAAEDIAAYTTSSYTTGWMNGDIKLAALADTTAETLSGSELVTNGDFPSGLSDGDVGYDNGDGTVDGWTASTDVELSIVSGAIRVQNNSTYSLGASGMGIFALTTTPNKVYVLEATVVTTNAVGSSGIGVSSSGQGTIRELGAHAPVGAGTYTITFTANSSTTYLKLFNWSVNANYFADFDNVSVRLADPDRSVNGNGLAVYGSITKAAVATGADVVAYSGFSGSNYLEQPYNSDLDFGTGDFCVMGWVNGSSQASFDRLFERSDGTNISMQLTQNGSNNVLYWRVAGDSIITPSAMPLDTWFHFCAVRNNGTGAVYINGISEVTGSQSTTVTLASATTVFGNSSTDLTRAFNGSLALWRISATAPTADQIKYIYDTERPLFQPNAKATLYGSSDAVTALAHDPVTDLLHVGTSSGRSVFQGLRRVDNTTTAVSTAISANDSLIVEQ